MIMTTSTAMLGTTNTMMMNGNTIYSNTTNNNNMNKQRGRLISSSRNTTVTTSSEVETEEDKETTTTMTSTTTKREMVLTAFASVAMIFAEPVMDAQALSLKSSNKNGVYWIEPKNNSTVKSPFVAKFGVKGYEVVPASAEFEEGTGHHHIIVDGEYMEKGQVIPFDATHLHYGKAQKEGEIKLEPGTHTLTLQFANGKHVSYGKRFASTITVNVE
jgi:hypothetical protein